MGLAVDRSRRAIEELFTRTTGSSRLGLERTTALLERLGNPERSLRPLHIAGTNGKGSVAATLTAVLRAQGHRVGMYTSPHLVEFTERILIDDRPVAGDRVADWIERHFADIDATGATFFEATTAMAFQLFAEDKVDLAVIETGLGGRLDATNVLRPLVAGVTSIGIDHVEYLGTTREEIAGEKAGIFKADIPAVIGEPDRSVRELLARHARDVRARPIEIVADRWSIENIEVRPTGTAFRLRDRSASGGIEVITPLIGAHQAPNCAAALAMLDALPAPWRVEPGRAIPALQGVRLPGRFQRSGKWLFDVAHNRDGAAVLAETLRRVEAPSPVIALVCVLGDKDWRGMLDVLSTAVDRFVITQAPTAPESRAWSPEAAGRHARERGWTAEVIVDFDRALAHAERLGGTVLVTGSFHTVGDAMARLSLVPYGA